jgi:hypothetical protein
MQQNAEVDTHRSSPNKVESTPPTSSQSVIKSVKLQNLLTAAVERNVAELLKR